jgi:hypothetical protein
LAGGRADQLERFRDDALRVGGARQFVDAFCDRRAYCVAAIVRVHR